MKWSKVLKKAFEGAVLAGGSAAGVTVPGSAEEAIPTILAALAGALLRGLWNWWQHRKT